MDQALFILGEAVSVLALAIMARATLTGWKRIQPGATAPLFFKRDGEPGLRVNSALALCLLPAIALVLLMLLSAQRPGGEANGRAMLFTMQALASAAFTAAHIVRVRQVLELLAKERKLR